MEMRASRAFGPTSFYLAVTICRFSLKFNEPQMISNIHELTTSSTDAYMAVKRCIPTRFYLYFARTVEVDVTGMRCYHLALRFEVSKIMSEAHEEIWSEIDATFWAGPR